VYVNGLDSLVNLLIFSRALRVRRGGRGAGRYQYYKLHDGLHPGDELKKDWMEMILTRHVW
jgi:hypothetical protein